MQSKDAMLTGYRGKLWDDIKTNVLRGREVHGSNIVLCPNGGPCW
jgi:hypothetical protein